MRGCDLRLDGRIALERECGATRPFDLVADLTDNLAASGDQRDLITCGEAAGQGRGETFADADHNTNLVQSNRAGIAHNHSLPACRVADGCFRWRAAGRFGS